MHLLHPLRPIRLSGNPVCCTEVPSAHDTPRPPGSIHPRPLFHRLRHRRHRSAAQKVGAQSSEDESQIRDSLKSFTNVYALVEQNYAEPINGDKADIAIYDGAIPGMLRDARSALQLLRSQGVREDARRPARTLLRRGHGDPAAAEQEGKDHVYVITPYEGTPSFRAGIRPGDIISAVDGKTTDGMTSDAVAKALKGPKGTHVQVTMIREGQAKPLTFDLVRDEIPHPSVDLKYEIQARASATST